MISKEDWAIRIICAIFVALAMFLGIIGLTYVIGLRLIQADVRVAVYFLIIFCLITILISIEGYVGLSKNDMYMIRMHIFLTIIIIIGIPVVLESAYSQEDINNLLVEYLNKSSVYDVTQEDAMINVQFKFMCCGVYGPEDYTAKNISMPSTCFADHNIPYSKGCYDDIKNMLKLHANIVVGLIWFIPPVEIVADLLCTLISIRDFVKSFTDIYTF